jgi:sugar phosphate isomerase/epimerase
MPIKPDPNAAGRGGRGAAGTGTPAVAIGDDSVNWPAVFAAAKTGGMKNYYIEQEQANGGWEAMIKGAAYLKTLNPA